MEKALIQQAVMAARAAYDRAEEQAADARLDALVKRSIAETARQWAETTAMEAESAEVEANVATAEALSYYKTAERAVQKAALDGT